MALYVMLVLALALGNLVLAGILVSMLFHFVGMVRDHLAYKKVLEERAKHEQDARLDGISGEDWCACSNPTFDLCSVGPDYGQNVCTGCGLPDGSLLLVGGK